MTCVGCIYTIKNQTVKGKDGEMVEVGEVTCKQTYACAGADRVTEKVIAEVKKETKRSKRKSSGE